MLLLNRTLLELARGLRRWILAIVALRFMVLFGVVRFAESLSEFLGDLFHPQMTGDALSGAVWSAAGAAVIMLIGHVLMGEAEYFCTSKARILLRGRILDKLFLLDVANVEQAGAANMVNLAANGVESMQNYYSIYLPALIYCLISPFYMFMRLYQYSMPIAAILLVITMSILPLNNVFRKITDKLKAEYWAGLSDLTGYYLEGLRSMTTLKLFNRDEDRTAVLKEKAYNFYSNIMAVMQMNFGSFLLTYSLMYVTIFAVTAMACSRLSDGTMGLSAAMLVLMLSFNFFSSIRELTNATHNALTGVSAAQNVAKLFEIPVEREFTKYSGKYADEKGIRPGNISFRYPGRNRVLEDVSMFFEEGTVTAIAGPSGCGKSTAASMLLRFLDPSGGNVYFDGVPYTDFTLEEIRRRVVMVPQRVGIFSGSVRENLLIANPDADDAMLWKALEDVGLAHWLRGMPEGLDTETGDSGNKLSGGQRQKIGIARALLSDAGYIIFDEATSSVDRESEQDIWNCIRNLSKTHTLIIISHRLSTIRDAGRIYILSGGHVAGARCHEELLEHCGLYSRMVEEQNILEAMGEEAVYEAE